MLAFTNMRFPKKASHKLFKIANCEEERASGFFICLPQISRMFFYSLPAVYTAPFSRDLLNKSLLFFFKRSGYAQMKLGQWIATRHDIFGKDLANNLVILQNKSKKSDLADVIDVLDKEIDHITRVMHQNDNCKTSNRINAHPWGIKHARISSKSHVHSENSEKIKSVEKDCVNPNIAIKNHALLKNHGYFLKTFFRIISRIKLNMGQIFTEKSFNGVYPNPIPFLNYSTHLANPIYQKNCFKSISSSFKSHIAFSFIRNKFYSGFWRNFLDKFKFPSYCSLNHIKPFNSKTFKSKEFKPLPSQQNGHFSQKTPKKPHKIIDYACPNHSVQKLTSKHANFDIIESPRPVLLDRIFKLFINLPYNLTAVKCSETVRVCLKSLIMISKNIVSRKKLAWNLQNNCLHSNIKLLQEIRKNLVKNRENKIYGAGCVAQVYKIYILGAPYAVKILHKNIRNRITLNINALKFIFKVLRFDQNILENFCYESLDQVDLLKEYNNLSIFRFNFEDSLYVYVPKPIFATKNILLEEWVEAADITKSIQETSLKEKRVIVDSLVSLMYKMILKDKFVHCDLHPGNILLDLNAKNPRIVILDAGLAKKIDTREYINLLDMFLQTFYYKNYIKAAELLIYRNPENLKNLHKINTKRFLKSFERLSTLLAQPRSAFDFINIFMSICSKNNVKLYYGYGSIFTSFVCLDGFVKRVLDDPYKNSTFLFWLKAPLSYLVKEYLRNHIFRRITKIN